MVFIDGKLTQHKIYIDEKKYNGKIFITIDIGSRYCISNIIIKQKCFAYDGIFIENLIGLKLGKYFTQNRVIKINKFLQDRGCFSIAQIVPQITIRDDKRKILPLDINLTSNYAQTYFFGLGYGIFTGPQITFGSVFSRLTKMGQQLFFDI